MDKQRSSLRAVGLEPYADSLNPAQAASAIQAARLVAIELLETAELLHAQERYPHSLAFSVLALEEAGKFQIVLALLLGLAGNPQELWRAYRHHTAKTTSFNFAIEMRAGVHFPHLTPEALRQVRDAGPTPEDLDAAKQLALYSDCFATPEGPVIHLPRSLDWKGRCEQLLVEASVLVGYLRDYPPEELEVWANHGLVAREGGKSFAEVMKPLCDELVAKGFVTSDQWAPIWKYLEDLNSPSGESPQKRDA